ncbi:MAG: hypothetical protein KGH66_00435 [Candidatus Micrarchaeota archaeon]|nr:hypothetical protein [Candidatus Micrarchaeota archaeon]
MQTKNETRAQKVVAVGEVMEFTNTVRNFITASRKSTDNSAYMIMSFRGTEPRSLVSFHTSESQAARSNARPPSPLESAYLVDMRQTNEEGAPRLVTFGLAFRELQRAGSAMVTVRVRESSGSSETFEMELIHGSNIRPRSDSSNPNNGFSRDTLSV